MDDYEKSSRCVFHVQNMPIVEPIERLNEETIWSDS
jgi:hypothetical protein